MVSHFGDIEGGIFQQFPALVQAHGADVGGAEGERANSLARRFCKSAGSFYSYPEKEEVGFGEAKRREWLNKKRKPGASLRTGLFVLGGQR